MCVCVCVCVCVCTAGGCHLREENEQCNDRGFCDSTGGCQCRRGYALPDCGQCDQGYISGTDAMLTLICSACVTSGALASILAIVAFVIMVVVAVVLSNLRVVREMSVSLRTASIYLQTVTLLSSLDLNWPTETENMFHMTHAAGGDLMEIIGCLFTYTNKWIVVMTGRTVLFSLSMNV
jgi:hypothetical protein